MTLEELIQNLQMQVEKSEIYITLQCLGFTPKHIHELCSVAVDFSIKTPLPEKEALLLFYFQAKILICYGKLPEEIIIYAKNYADTIRNVN